MNEKTEKLSGTERQRQIEAAVTIAMQGYRRDIELQRGKTVRLREMRLARDAVISVPPAAAKAKRPKAAR